MPDIMSFDHRAELNEKSDQKRKLGYEKPN